MNKIDELIDQARDEGGFECRESEVSDVEIEQLEKTLSISLPDDYRYYLKTYGAIEWDNGIVPGLPDENDELREYKDLYTRNESYRKDYASRERFKNVPDTGLIIDKYDGGGYYFLYCKGHEREGQVAWHLDENWGNENAYWESFTDFLSYLVTNEPNADRGSKNVVG